MGRHLVLHIGVEKTGSKAIQCDLRANADALARQGVLFPKTPGPGNHTHAVAASMNDDVHCATKSNILASKSITLKKLREDLAKALDQEIANAGGADAIIVSSELVHSRLRSHEEIERLLGFFKPYVDRISVVVFLRRQDRLAVSNFSASLRAGFAGLDGIFADRASNRMNVHGDSAPPDDFKYFYDYAQLLDRFAPFVKPEDIHPLIYEDEVASKSPLVQRVVEIAGANIAELDFSNSRVNESLTQEQQFLFAKVNELTPIIDLGGRRHGGQKRIHRLIEEEVGGKKRQIEREKAVAFLSRFDASNETVREKYFPSKKSLFDNDFDAYPESVAPFVPSQDLLNRLGKYTAIAKASSNIEPASRRILRAVKNKVRLHMNQSLF